VTRRPTLSLNEWAVLGLLAERPRHGYDVAAELHPEAEVGQVWRLSRKLVYRAVERLGARGLAHVAHTEPGTGGPPRTVHAATPEGHARLADWLASPVEHVRDMRSAFLLKLVLARRLGVGTAPLVRAQRAHLDAHLVALGEPPAGDVVARWRRHSAQAARAFLDVIDADAEPDVADADADDR
jgi:DNA-binding PadR family transcriptional regulator